MFKRALVSVSDKGGLVEFLKPIIDQGCEVVSTGGTSAFLKKHGIPVTEVAQVTGFPEVMDGRVRTLHPHIHMALLARSFVPEDLKLLMEHKIQPFDLVVVNLYPFENAYLKEKLTGQELIEQIDIGGPTLLRASAKSFERVTVVCDPQDYAQVLERAQGDALDESYRRNLAVKVFNHCAFYDSLVTQALCRESEIDPLSLSYFTTPLRKRQTLRYGENPHQKAALYENPIPDAQSLLNAEFLQGKELSYNNILDLESAVAIASDFSGVAAAIVKHNNPCGVGLGKSSLEAYKAALECDPVSAFGGIVAVTGKVDGALVEEMSKIFLECVVAPDISDDALSVFAKKKNLRVLRLPSLGKNHDHPANDYKSIRGGMLLQSADCSDIWSPDWRIVGAQKPTQQIKEALLLAQKVARHLRSNAISVVQGSKTVGLCGGQTNRIDSVKMALQRAKGRGFVENLVLGSDAFFPFRDSIDIAAEYGVGWIIQPGGSVKDAEVEAACIEKGIGMVITGKRHFKH